MKKFLAVLLSLILCLSMFACNKGKDKGDGTITGAEDIDIITADTSEMDFEFTKTDTDPSYNEGTATKIVFSGSTATVTGNGAAVLGNVVTISAAGTYLVSGEATDASLTVEAGKEDKLQIVLSGASILASDRPAIYIKSADKVFLTLADGTENYLSDGSSYEITDDETTLDASLFSREDITVNGSGSLTVNGNYKHGIVSKDDLVVVGASLNVKANNVALSGKDCVKISGGTLTLEAGSDGIRSDNDTDENRGYVYIDGAKIKITAENDGVQAETVLKIESGEFDITCGGGSKNSSSNSDGSWNTGWRPGMGMGMGSSSSSSNEESAKGLKAVSDILISGGSFKIDSADDCIHSNAGMSITDGDFTLSSGDDGIHADTALGISGGNIVISKSYEGIESSDIVISGGNISVVASDDGLNAAGGNDGSAMGGRPGQGFFSGTTGAIVISGGYLLVDASGDGIDSNGTILVSGGVTLVSGPTNSGNGAFDHDGSAKVTGGVLIATGSAGMAEPFDEAENQGAIYTTFSTQSGGTSLALCDKDGRVIVAFTPTKNYQSVTLTAPKVQKGETYTLVTGGKVSGADSNGYAEDTTVSGGTTIATIEMTSLVYGSSGIGSFGGGMGGMGDFGGNKPS